MSHPTAPIHLLDGGLGTTLLDQFHAHIDGALHPLWSSHLLISDPETLQKCQRAFGDAGADVVITGTYQGSLEGFARTKLNEKGIGEEGAEAYMSSAVGIARRAFAGRDGSRRKGAVALSLGAYGATMVPSQEYTGHYDDAHESAEQLQEWHARRLSIFSSDPEVWKDVDIIAFETLPRISEIRAARKVMEGVDRPFWISCVFPGEGRKLPDGSTVNEAVEAMLDGTGRRPDGVGFNCVALWKVEGLVAQFEGAIRRWVAGEGEGEDGSEDEEEKKPVEIESREVEVDSREREWPALVMYPDGTRREVYNTVTQAWEAKEGGDSGEVVPWDREIFDLVKKTRAKGSWREIYVGGCCKTTPQMIGSLRKRLDTLEVQQI